MDIPLIEQFFHSQIITKCKINVSELSDDLRVMITDFNRRYNGFKLKPKEDNLKILTATSNLIGQNIYDYYVSEEDQTVDINPNVEPSKQDIKDVVADIKEEMNKPDGVEQNPPAAPVDPAGKPTSGPDPAAGGETKPNEPVPSQEPPKPQEPEYVPANANDKALHDLFTKGVTENITMAMLKEAGFNTSSSGPLSIRGCKTKGYHIYKEFSDKVFKLKKI